MKYKSLNTLPLKVFKKISDNLDENIYLLSDDKSDKITELKNHWNSLQQSFKEVDKITKSNGFSIVKIIIELAYLKNKYHIIFLSLKSLEFAYNQDLINLILDEGYQISRKNLQSDIKKIYQIIDVQTEFIKFLPEDINRFDLLDYYCCWMIILNRQLDISYENVTVGGYFDIQIEAIKFLNQKVK